MDETHSHETPTPGPLLEFLRQKLVVVHPTSPSEELEKMNLILDRQSEFPSRIRTTIAEAAASDQQQTPSAFLQTVYEAGRALLSGRRSGPDDTNRENDLDFRQAVALDRREAVARAHRQAVARARREGGPHVLEEPPPIALTDIGNATADSAFDWWHGLDITIDTEDEAEVLIRLFPRLLTEKLKASPLSSLNDCYPIYVLLVCSRAMPFIPLFAHLGTELDLFPQEERGGLVRFMRNVIVQLVCNTVLRDVRESSGQIDELSAGILERLYRNGLVTEVDVTDCDLVGVLLHRSLRRMNERNDARFRVLVDLLSPSVLVDCGRGGLPLLGHYLRILHQFIVDHRKAMSCDMQRFRAIFALGMAHEPSELGFIFHGNCLALACEIFGTKKAKAIVDDELATILRGTKKLVQENDDDNKNNSDIHGGSSNNSSSRLRTLVIAAATNQKINLDGVYTLVRRDPIVLLPESATNTD